MGSISPSVPTTNSRDVNIVTMPGSMANRPSRRRASNACGVDDPGRVPKDASVHSWKRQNLYFLCCVVCNGPQ